MDEYCVCMLTPANEQVRFTTFADSPEAAERRARKFIPEIVRIMETRRINPMF